MKKGIISLFTFACGAGMFLTASSADAGVVFTIENPTVQASTVAGVTTETFDSFAVGAFSGSILGGVGTLTPGGAIAAPDAYGGANASRYYAVGVQSGQLASTLTLNSPQHYFGMWWAAGDWENHLEIYDEVTLLGSYRVADIIPFLSSAYFGNPNSNPNNKINEPFVYLDFTATGSSHITSVRFLNEERTSGFEMDNFSILDRPIDPPGYDPVPDGGSASLMLGAATMLLSLLRKRA